MILIYLAAFLFCIGFTIVLVKKNLIHLLLGIELMLNAVNINLVAFNQINDGIQGVMFSLFVILVAVAETSIALAMVLQLVKKHGSANVTQFNKLKE